MADALTALAASTGTIIPNIVNSVIGPGAIANLSTEAEKENLLSTQDLALLKPYINNFGTTPTLNGKPITTPRALKFFKGKLLPREIRIACWDLQIQLKISASGSEFEELVSAFASSDYGDNKELEFTKSVVIVTTLNKVYFAFSAKGIYFLSEASNFVQPPSVPKVDKTPASATGGVTPAAPISKIDETKPVAPTINVPSTETPVATKVEDFSNKFNPADAFYRIIYTDNQNSTKAFVFTFLPARETKMGNWNVPEARTGMPIQTKMRHKMQVIPGAGPIVQTIGVNGTTITVVGALLGNEIIAQDFVGAGPSAYPRYESGTFSGAETEGIYSAGLPRGAYDKVQELTNRLVYPGRPVTIEIKPSNSQATFQMGEGKNNIGDFIRMTGVVTAVRVQYAHSDRCYYALDLFVTSYPNQPVSLNPDVTASASDTTPIAFATTTNQDGVDLNSLSELDPIETQAIPLTPFAKVAANFLSGQPILSSVSQAIAAFDDRTISNVSTIAQSGNIYNAISNLSATGLSTTAQMETLAQLAQLSNIDSTGIAAITAAITRGVG